MPTRGARRCREALLGRQRAGRPCERRGVCAVVVVAQPVAESDAVDAPLILDEEPEITHGPLVVARRHELRERLRHAEAERVADR